MLSSAVSLAGEKTSGPELESTLDPVLQPGIVEDITGEPILFFDQRFPITATAGLEGYEDDNVFISPASKESGDFVWEILPEVVFESSVPDDHKRHYLTFGYDPQVLRFSEFTENDSYNHRGTGRYRFQSNRLEAELFHRSAQFSGANREIQNALFENIDSDLGRRADGDRHLTKLTTRLDLSDELFLESTASRFLRNFDSEFLPNSEEWRGETFLMSRIAPKTMAGIGARIGEIQIDDSPDHVYQELLARVIFNPSPKLTIDMGGGLDFRQFDGAGAGDDEDEVIFASRITWRKSEATQVSVEAFRDVYYSVGGDSIVRDALRGSVRQRLHRNLYYVFRGGYEWRDYEPSRRETAVLREDNFLYFVNQIDYELSDWGTIGLFHEFRKNDSSTATSFERNQSGFRVSIQF